MSSVSIAESEFEMSTMLEALSSEQQVEQASSAYFDRKLILDRLLAAALLLPALPIMGLLLALIRLTSKGPGIYRQQRVGQNGRVFTMLKLRSMRCDAERGSGAVWAPTAKDARVTWIGRILRATHLDELPQLLNVLSGEMSLVGPRPERPEFVGILAEAIPAYPERLAVRPGITGLAQLNLPPDSDLDSVRRKLVLDLEYIEQAGFWMDACLLLTTLLRIVRVPGGAMLRLLGLSRRVCLVEAAQRFDLGDRSITVDEDAVEISSDLLAKLLAQSANDAAANDGAANGAVTNGEANGRHGCCADAPAGNGNGNEAGASPHIGRAAARRSSGARLPR